MRLRQRGIFHNRRMIAQSGYDLRDLKAGLLQEGFPHRVAFVQNTLWPVLRKRKLYHNHDSQTVA